MSKKVKSIIFGGAILLVLVAALLVLLFLPKPTDNATTSSTTATNDLVAVISEEMNTLTSIHVKNPVDEYTVESLGEQKWGLKAFGDLPQDDVYSDMASAVSNIYANSVVAENADDLSQFGLDKPQLTLEIKFSTGSSYKLLVGDIVDSAAVAYTMLEGNKTVYQIAPSKYTVFMGKSIEFISHSILPALEVDDQGSPVTPSIEKLSIERKDLDKPLIFTKTVMTGKSANYMPLSQVTMESPVYSEAKDDAVTKTVNSFFAISAKEIAAINPTDEDKTSLGFDDPTATVNMTYDETSKFTLTVGNAVDVEGEKCHYLMSDKQPIIYTVADSALLFLQSNPKEFISSIALLVPVLDMKSTTIIIDSETYRLDVTQGDDKTDTKEISFTLNGKEVDADLAKKYIQVLYATGIEDLNTATPSKTPDITIVYEYITGKTEKVEIYTNEDRSTIVSLNGNNAFKGRGGYAEKIKDTTKRLIADEEFITDW